MTIETAATSDVATPGRPAAPRSRKGPSPQPAEVAWRCHTLVSSFCPEPGDSMSVFKPRFVVLCHGSCRKLIRPWRGRTGPGANDLGSNPSPAKIPLGDEAGCVASVASVSPSTECRQQYCSPHKRAGTVKLGFPYIKNYPSGGHAPWLIL